MQFQFDVPLWLQKGPEFEGSSCGWVFGASYLEGNVGALAERLFGTSSDQIEQEIRWLRPAGEIWGMTPDLGIAIETLRRAVGLPDTPRASGTTLVTPRSVVRLTHKRLSRMFELGEEAPQKLGSSLEIVVVGRAVAMVLVHVLVDRNETIPVGIVTDHQSLVARLYAQLRGPLNRLWHTSPRSKPSVAEDASRPFESVED